MYGRGEGKFASHFPLDGSCTEGAAASHPIPSDVWKLTPKFSGPILPMLQGMGGWVAPFQIQGPLPHSLLGIFPVQISDIAFRDGQFDCLCKFPWEMIF